MENVEVSFAEALQALKKGAKIKRTGWKGWLLLKRPTTTSDINVPYIAYKNADHDLIPSHLSDQDILSDDWEIIL